ncbi:MAG: hypothetical protein ACKKMW_01990 [Candidatus Nealsonbacteria bacterium]
MSIKIKQMKWVPYATPVIFLVIIAISLPLFLTYEQPSIFLDFDSVQSPEINFETITLKNGDNQIHGSEYYNNSLWFSTRTNPARVIKMNPDTLEYEKILLDGNDGEDIIEANGSIFVIIYNGPTKVIKINPDNLKVEKTIEIKEMSHGGSLLYDFGYLWAGGGVGKIAKININDYSYIIYDYPTGNQFHALTSGNGYLWGSCPSLILGNTIIFRINPENPEKYESVTMKKKVTDDMTYLDDALYVGSENQHLGAVSFLYKIFDNLTYIPVSTQRTIRCYGVFQNDGFLWAAYTGNPGTIIKFNNEFELISVIQLPSGFNDANEIIFDANGNMFVTCFQSPAKVVKLNIASS